MGTCVVDVWHTGGGEKQSHTQAALALKILRGAYPPVRGYSAELIAIIDRCLCTRRASRPATDKLLVLPSVQRWASTLGIELPLVPQPRRAVQAGHHARASSWSPAAAEQHGRCCNTVVTVSVHFSLPTTTMLLHVPLTTHPSEASSRDAPSKPHLLHTMGSRMQAPLPGPSEGPALQGHTMLLTQRKERADATQRRPPRHETAHATIGNGTSKSGGKTAVGAETSSPPASSNSLADAIAKQHAACVRLLGREGLEALLLGLTTGAAHVAPLAADGPVFRCVGQWATACACVSHLLIQCTLCLTSHSSLCRFKHIAVLQGVAGVPRPAAPGSGGRGIPGATAAAAGVTAHLTIRGGGCVVLECVV